MIWHILEVKQKMLYGLSLCRLGAASNIIFKRAPQPLCALALQFEQLHTSQHKYKSHRNTMTVPPASLSDFEGSSVYLPGMQLILLLQAGRIC